MSFSLPNPTSPTNGNPLDASPILANFIAIQQAIDSFDGSQLQAKTITEQALADAINPRLRGLETIANFVYSGCVWSASSGLTGVMTGGTVYVNGYRTIVNGIGSETFPASKDTYIDIDYLGNVTYQSVSNNAAAPSLTANSIRVAQVITGASSISSVSTFGSDSLGNIIYPTGPSSTAKLQNPCKFRVYRTAVYAPGSNQAVIAFDTKQFDSGNNIDVTTNKGRFTAPIAGFYQFNAGLSVTSSTVGVAFYKNGSQATAGTLLQGISSAQNSVSTSDIIELAAGDYVEAVYSLANTSNNISVGALFTFFSGFLVSAT